MNDYLLEDIKEDVFAILEQLYNSATAISEKRINQCAEDLCKNLGIDPEVLEAGLNVKHYRG